MSFPWVVFFLLSDSPLTSVHIRCVVSAAAVAPLRRLLNPSRSLRFASPSVFPDLMPASAPYQQLEGSNGDAVSAPGGPLAQQSQSDEVAQLRAMVAQQAAQQQILMQQIAAMQAQQQQQQQQQLPPGMYPVPGGRNPSGLPPAGYGAAAQSRPIQQNMLYPQPVRQSMCEVMGCRGVATGRCGSTTCCETCNKRICVEHSGWTRSGRGGRVAACPEHSRGQCVIS